MRWPYISDFLSGESMNSAHETKIIRVNEIRKHPNADTLGLVDVGGYQVVVKLGEYAVGDLAVYVQPDSIVPCHRAFAFVWNDQTFEGEIPEKKRRVTVRRFRKEWSEGLLMSLASVGLTDKKGAPLFEEGADVANILGITHYNPPEPGEFVPTQSSKQYKVWPKSLKGWAHFLSYWMTFGLYNPSGSTHGFGNERPPKNTPPMYDVETFKNYANTFVEGEPVVVTEKIHGSNARYVAEKTRNWYGKEIVKFYAGSRKLWKSSGSSNVWRKAAEANPGIEKFCRTNPGFVLYGEATPTQKGFDYGALTEVPRFFLFDVRFPDGYWMDYISAIGIAVTYNIETVPELYIGPYNFTEIANFVDGRTAVPGAKHIREGVVIRSLEEREVRGLGRAQLKIVSNAYYEKNKEAA